MKNDTKLMSEVMEKIPNKYMAVIVSSKRARAINDGSRVLVKSGATKNTTIAMEEVAAELVVPEAKKPEIEAVEETGKELPPPPDDKLEDNKPETETEVETEEE